MLQTVLSQPSLDTRCHDCHGQHIQTSRSHAHIWFSLDAPNVLKVKLSSVLLKLQLRFAGNQKIPALLSHILNRAQNCCAFAHTSSGCDHPYFPHEVPRQPSSHHIPPACQEAELVLTLMAITSRDLIKVICMSTRNTADAELSTPSTPLEDWAVLALKSTCSWSSCKRLSCRNEH